MTKTTEHNGLREYIHNISVVLSSCLALGPACHSDYAPLGDSFGRSPVWSIYTYRKVMYRMHISQKAVRVPHRWNILSMAGRSYLLWLETVPLLPSFVEAFQHCHPYPLWERSRTADETHLHARRFHWETPGCAQFSCTFTASAELLTHGTAGEQRSHSVQFSDRSWSRHWGWLQQ